MSDAPVDAAEARPVLGGGYQCVAVAKVPMREGDVALASVLLDVWDRHRKAMVATLDLLPDEARELARRLVRQADLCR